MSLVFADGCDSYSGTSDVVNKWTQGFTGSFSSSAGRLNGGALQFAAGQSASSPQFSGYTNLSLWAFGFWMKQSAVPNAVQNLCIIGTAQFASFWGMRLQTTGVPGQYDTGGVLRTAGVTNVCDNNWHWIEYTLDGAGGGACRTWLTVDGVTQWNTGSSFQSTAAAPVQFMMGNGGNGAAGTLTIDDPFFYDANSPAPTSTATLTLLGQKQITTVRPSSDNSVQFAPDSGATNYSRVNEVGADDDTSYVQDNISGHTDLYGYSSLSFTPSSITAIQLVSRLKNPGAGSVSFKNRCSSGGTVSDGTSTIAQSAYALNRTIYGQDPHTSAAWIKSGLDSALFGVTVV